MLLTLFQAGWLGGKAAARQSSDFIFERVPVRQPRLKAIAVKTVARVEWYLKEVPACSFVAGTALLVSALDKLGPLVQLSGCRLSVVQGQSLAACGTASVFDWFFRAKDFGAAWVCLAWRAGDVLTATRWWLAWW
ncbi:MAG: hypothetical protein H6656_10175 [Ardenticatenaceae bacterium]|nr:hypothetical protein [Ardenticatenaceae bacterium]